MAKRKKSDALLAAEAMTWQELSETVPQGRWRDFVEIVTMAEVARTLSPKAARYKNHPIVLLIEDFLASKRVYCHKAVYAVAGTDKKARLLLDKS